MRIFTTILLLLICISSQARSHDILFPAKVNGLWGYVDTGGEWVIKPQFFKAQPFHEGLAAVKDLSKWGFINKNGSWEIDARYDQASSFEEGLAAVVFNNRWGFIDQQGNVIIPFVYEKVSSFSEGTAVVSSNDHYQYVDHRGTLILDGAFTSASPFVEGLALVNWGDKNGFINQRGQVVLSDLPSTGLFSEGFARVKVQGKWGFMDRSGNIVISPEFDGVGRFKNGMSPVKKREKWGAIDFNGEYRIKTQFQSLGNFYHGYAIAQENDLWGIVDANGSWVVAAEFHGMGHAGKSVGLKRELSDHVLASFAQWKRKGEFEKSDEFQARLTQENQKSAMDSLFWLETKEHGDGLMAASKKSLGFYNADAEYFTFYIPGFLPSSIGVPIDQARNFKDNWEYATINVSSYGFAGEYFVLKEFSIAVNGEVFDKNLTDPTVAVAAGWVPELEVPNIEWEEENRISYTPSKVKPGTSDVDINIPSTNFDNVLTFALIIGNEDYKSFQGGFDSEINVSYASTDAKIFSKYVHQTLGVPEKNITLLENATAGQMKQALAKMNKIAKAYDGEAEFIFYYAGHGLPDEVSRKPYLIPVDVNGSDLSFAISLDEALNTLAEHPHQRITVFLDACFTGGGRKEGLVASRGVKIRPKSPFVRGNLVMFSASSAQQSAFAFEEKAHGMFTYFLLKKLQESQGKVSFEELSGYLEFQVPQHAIVHNDKEQNPEILVSPSLEEVWNEFNLLTPFSAEVSSRN